MPSPFKNSWEVNAYPVTGTALSGVLAWWVQRDTVPVSKGDTVIGGRSMSYELFEKIQRSRVNSANLIEARETSDSLKVEVNKSSAELRRLEAERESLKGKLRKTEEEAARLEVIDKQFEKVAHALKALKSKWGQ